MGNSGDKSQLQVGDIIKIGSYPQTKEEERKPIEWKVLQIDDGKALVHSVYGLDRKPYNVENANASWEYCSLRNWLNQVFMKRAFSPDERKCIFKETVSDDWASEYNDVPSEDTEDHLFVLSVNEVETYYPEIKDRNCLVTEYAAMQGEKKAPAGKFGYWWLRSFGNSGSSPVEVGTDGWICHYGYRLNDEEHYVRPAMWIDL